MSNSTTLLDTISVASSNKEAVANALFDAASPSMLWGRHASACNLLTWGYYGGSYTVGTTVNSVANGTVTLTASTTNYLMANPTTGAVTANTTGFTSGLIPLYSIVTNATTVTSYTDCRSYAPSATGSGGGGGSGTVTSVGATGGAETDQTSAGAITASGNIRTALKPIPLTGNYTIASTDRGCCYLMNDASASVLTLATPTGTTPTTTFPSGWWAELNNYGAGACTITPPSGVSLDGVVNGTLAVPTRQGCGVFTDGTNWFTIRGIQGSGGGGSSTFQGLTDVNVSPGSGINGYVVNYNYATGKWIATQLQLASTGTTAAFDPSNKSPNITLSNSNLTATSTTTNWEPVRSTVGKSSGKLYAELTINNISGAFGFGICNSAESMATNYIVGTDTNGIIMYNHPTGPTQGVYYNSSALISSLGSPAPTTGNTVGLAVDLAANKIWFYNPGSGTWNNDVIANQNPALGVGGFSISAINTGTVYLAANVLGGGTGNPQITLNAGSSAFANAIPSGFSAWAALTPSLIADVTVTSPVAGQSLTFDGTVWRNTGTPYDMLMFSPGVPGNSALMSRVVIPRAITIPAGATGSYASSSIAATASTVLTLAKNGTTIGTITFAASGATGTFSFSSAVTTVAGDVLTLTNQATADATLANISVTLAATR